MAINARVVFHVGRISSLTERGGRVQILMFVFGGLRTCVVVKRTCARRRTFPSLEDSCALCE